MIRYVIAAVVLVATGAVLALVGALAEADRDAMARLGQEP